jgi:phage gpG-like protein
LPRRIPESATQFRQYLVELTTQTNPAVPGAPPAISARQLEVLRRPLVHHAGRLHAILSPAWRQYLALPGENLDPAAIPNLEALTALEQRFARIATTPNYKSLADDHEFRITHELLREYIHALSSFGPLSHLPPPPVR